MTGMRLAAVGFAALGLAGADRVVVVTAGGADYVLAAGGTLAEMAGRGAEIHVLRLTNDEKDSWRLTPEETAARARREAEAAGALLGVKSVTSLGYRAWELGAVSFTELRDRIMLFIRHHKPRTLFIPNPHTHYDRVLDRYYAGRAAEDAWRSAGVEGVQPVQAEAGLQPHITHDVYYYAPPVDPERRTPEASATFVPQPKVVEIGAGLAKKIAAAQVYVTANESLARRLEERLRTSGRRLPVLDEITPAAIRRLVEENVRGLAKLAAAGTGYAAAEEFHYAGIEFRIPASYR